MRITIAHPALVTSSSTEGGIKSTRALVAALVASGHDCDVVSIAPDNAPSAPDLWRTLDWERHSSFRPKRPIVPGSVRLSLTPGPGSVGKLRSTAGGTGVTLAVMAMFVCLRQAFLRLVRRRVREFQPDWVLWENGVGSLRTALSISAGRLLVQVKSPALLPFGPHGAPPWFHLTGVGVYRRVPKFLVPSQFMRQYMGGLAGADPCVQPNLSYGKPPFPLLTRPDGAVTMINPTPAKGVSIFLAMAQAFPEQRFRAVQTWGTIPPALSSLRNVSLVGSSESMDEVLQDTKVLLVPSMWGEAFGMVCVDAMARGIPVVYSNDGGVPEAALGVGEPLPVAPRTIRRGWLRPTVFTYGSQDLEGWRRKLGELLRDRGAFEARAQQSREVALRHIDSLSVEPLERYLRGEA